MFFWSFAIPALRPDRGRWKMAKKGGRAPTPNDNRSRAMNRQDAVGQMAMDNRSVQLNTSTGAPAPATQKSKAPPTETTQSTT